jgi:hypothetical protein
MKSILNRNELFYPVKDKRRTKKTPSLTPIIPAGNIRNPELQMLMAKVLFKGPGSRYTPLEGAQIKMSCNHKPLPMTEVSMTTEESVRWFFRLHSSDLEACCCFLNWLDSLVAGFVEVDDKFLLTRWNLVEKIWEERENKKRS